MAVFDNSYFIFIFLRFIEHESAMNKYMKIPKKKDNEKSRQETNEDLYIMRKKFHQVRGDNKVITALFKGQKCHQVRETTMS